MVNRQVTLGHMMRDFYVCYFMAVGCRSTLPLLTKARKRTDLVMYFALILQPYNTVNGYYTHITDSTG
jgi:hypothetical protein